MQNENVTEPQTEPMFEEETPKTEATEPETPETEATESDETAVEVDPGDVVRDIVVNVVEEMNQERLKPTSLEMLKNAFTESRQIQLGMEGVEDKFVFDFKPISPEQVIMQTTVLIPPELEQYTRPVDPGKTAPPVQPRAQQQLNRLQQQRENEIMRIVSIPFKRDSASQPCLFEPVHARG